MSLTPEQFNKLATKEDLEELKREMATNLLFPFITSKQIYRRALLFVRE